MGEQKKKNELSENYWIVKSNTLNEMRKTHMSISQMRLFAIYLSKINPKELNSREVTFKLEEYTKIMQFKQANTTRLEESAKELLRVVITFREEKKEGEKLKAFTSCQLFKRVKLHKDNEDEWAITIDCHDDVTHLMFELHKYFFKYKLWNILQLTSDNQQRMYEILKQYEYAGVREISVNDLREFLGIKPEEYPRWDNFRRFVLEASQEALARHTDIKFTWEVAGKRGKGGKINRLKFNIEKNEDYIRQYSFLNDYMEEQPKSEIIDHVEGFDHLSNNNISFLSGACEDEFSMEELSVLRRILVKIIPYDHSISSNRYNLNLYDYLSDKYLEFKKSSTKTIIKYRFNYFKAMIEGDI
jgi:plasmid replication initiation protein